MSSFGDWIALSDVCDEDTAHLICQGGLRRRDRPRLHRRARWKSSRPSARAPTTSFRSTLTYRPDPMERKQVFGVTFEQGRNELKIDREHACKRRHRKQGHCPKARKIDLHHRPDHPQIHAVQLGLLCLRTGRPSASARDSRAVSTAPAWRAARRTTGSCASTPRF